MSIQQQILETVQYGIEQAMKNKQTEYKGKYIGSSNGKYNVRINGMTYSLYKGVNVTLTVNDSVWVHAPYGNMRNAYIAAIAEKNAS